MNLASSIRLLLDARSLPGRRFGDMDVIDSDILRDILLSELPGAALNANGWVRVGSDVTFEDITKTLERIFGPDAVTYPGRSDRSNPALTPSVNAPPTCTVRFGQRDWVITLWGGWAIDRNHSVITHTTEETEEYL